MYTPLLMFHYVHTLLTPCNTSRAAPSTYRSTACLHTQQFFLEFSTAPQVAADEKVRQQLLEYGVTGCNGHHLGKLQIFTVLASQNQSLSDSVRRRSPVEQAHPPAACLLQISILSCLAQNTPNLLGFLLVATQRPKDEDGYLVPLERELCS
ncbi:hypothetical protein B0H14DRAFT_2557280 [Mycena olivaceomarginata]|nr:hypothetical protein B0H14DRAFT_2557280 [Mycena olivaceomarginata]